MSYLPRFILAVVVVPLAYVLVAFAAARAVSTPMVPSTPAAVAGAVTFALVVLAPSTRNAAVRAAIALAVCGAAAGVAFAVG